MTVFYFNGFWLGVGAVLMLAFLSCSQPSVQSECEIKTDCQMADLDGDGVVGLPDLGIWNTLYDEHFGQRCE